MYRLLLKVTFPEGLSGWVSPVKRNEVQINCKCTLFFFSHSQYSHVFICLLIKYSTLQKNILNTMHATFSLFKFSTTTTPPSTPALFPPSVSPDSKHPKGAEVLQLLKCVYMRGDTWRVFKDKYKGKSESEDVVIARPYSYSSYRLPARDAPYLSHNNSFCWKVGIIGAGTYDVVIIPPQELGDQCAPFRERIIVAGSHGIKQARMLFQNLIRISCLHFQISLSKIAFTFPQLSRNVLRNPIRGPKSYKLS